MNTNASPSSRESRYVHSRYRYRRMLCKFLLKTLAFTMMIKMDRVEGMENIPETGPAILMINHIAFIDPLVLVHVVRRYIVPMAKEEVYDYPVIGIFPRLWGVIPVHREGIDRRAIQRALDVLKAGEIVLVAPEGTRHQALQDAKEGVAYLAARANAPIVPVGIMNTPGFPAHPFSKRWRQGPGVRVKIGKPFWYKPEYRQARGEQLRLMMDEAMYLLADLLPGELRGIYQDGSRATQDTLQFSAPSLKENN